MSDTELFLEKSNEELLLEYKETKDLEIKQILTLRYVPMIKSIAFKMRDIYSNFTQLDDVVNECVITIMSSIDKFDLDKNVKFETYVSKRIRGQIIDLARKNDWISRQARQRVKKIEQVTNELYNRLGREPKEEEIASELGLTYDQYLVELKKVNLYQIISLDVVMDESNEKSYFGEMPSDDVRARPEETFLEGEKKEYLKTGLAQLRENEQLVVSLYYKEEMNLKAIGEILNVSEARVCQIHSNAIKKLRKHMERF